MYRRINFQEADYHNTLKYAKEEGEKNGKRAGKHEKALEIAKI